MTAIVCRHAKPPPTQGVTEMCVNVASSVTGLGGITGIKGEFLNSKQMETAQQHFNLLL